MYKQVMLLGLLLEKSMYGQQIREVIEKHHNLFADFIKKPTIYYQLERLTQDGYLQVRRETVEAPGTGAAHDELALRERDVYYITEAGRKYFYELLRESMGTYTPGLNEIEACLFFLKYLEPGEAIVSLKERYELVARDRAVLIQQIREMGSHNDAHNLVNDHKLALLEAELNWLARTIVHLEAQRVSSI
ncbi:MAG TPA: PadR family transcriptional regulator [Ktedonobacteraceae bacterium]|nr:PadR family transcriptional regulator [Ktedonobacteraceae bacterium]HYB01504.1 PadR family transcriptional regulator [Ktedonobacteraceae bacterium]